METETNNRPVRKIAKVTGFIALLVVIAWVSILLVRNVPGSFASLASLAQSVRGGNTAETAQVVSDDEATLSDRPQDMLIVSSDINVIENNGTVRLSWTDTSAQGSFVFSYQCKDGVAISIVEATGERNIVCDTNYNLGNVNDINLNLTSEKERFVDVTYAVSFLETDAVEPTVTDEAVITVINEDVPLFATNNTGEVTVAEPEASVEETPEESTPTTEPATPTEPVTTSPVQSGPEFVQEFTYTIPVSNPNGRIDIATRFLGTGEIFGNSFVSGPIAEDASGAIQFEVKNLGTKTSNDWTYSVSLPTGGMIESDDQAPLKPNERAVITIGFPAANMNDYNFEVIIDTTEDNTSINDRFIETVTFVN